MSPSLFFYRNPSPCIHRRLFIIQQPPGAGKARYHTGTDKTAGKPSPGKKTAIGRKNAITSKTR